jgi:hypothetical protein
VAKELATYRGSFWWDSLDKYAPEGGNNGSTSQHGRGLRMGGLGNELSSVDDVSEQISFGMSLAYSLWLSITTKGVRGKTSRQEGEVKDEGN